MENTIPRKRIGWKILAIVVIALVVIGVVFYGYLQKEYQQRRQKDSNATFIKPRVELQQLHFKRFDGKDTRLDITIKVHNPMPVTIEIDSLQYQVYMAGEKIADSRHIEKVTLESMDSTIVTLKLKLDNDTHRVAFEKATKNGKDTTDYKIIADAYVDVPSLAGKAINYEMVKRLPAFFLPHVTMEKMKVDKAGLNKTTITLNTELHNPNSFPMRFKNAHFIFVLGDDTLKVGDIDGVTAVAPRDSTKLEIPIELKTSKAIELATSMWLKPDNITYYYYFESNMISKNPGFEESTAVTEARGKLSDLKKTN